MEQYSLEICWCEVISTNHHTQYLLAWPGKSVTNDQYQLCILSAPEFNYEIISSRHDIVLIFNRLNILQPGKYSAPQQCHSATVWPHQHPAWPGEENLILTVPWLCRALSGPDGKASPGLSLNQWSLQENEAKYIIDQCGSAAVWQCVNTRNILWSRDWEDKSDIFTPLNGRQIALTKER